MEFIKFMIVLCVVGGSVFSILFAILYVMMMSKTKKGKQLRHEFYQLIEMGRRNE